MASNNSRKHAILNLANLKRCSCICQTTMNERTQLLNKSPSRKVDEVAPPAPEEESYWGGTPELRKLWLARSTSSNVLNQITAIAKKEGETDVSENEPYIKDDFIPYGDVEEVRNRMSTKSDAVVQVEKENQPVTCKSVSSQAFLGAPGLLIAIVLNLFLSMSFGQAFFPTSWAFPPEVPRAIGVQMFLFSTFLCQLVLTSMSEFPTAMGMMMVENIPFLHMICEIIVKQMGPGVDTFSTVLVAFALSTIVVGISFLLLGKFKVGNAVYFFPKHVIIGCIGGEYCEL
jgi:hypothetical protein